jgi:hypothetical protein
MKTNLLTLHGLDHILRLQGLSCNQVAMKMGRHSGYRQNVLQWRNLKKKCTYRVAGELAAALSVEVIDLVQQPNLQQSINDLTYAVGQYVKELQMVREMDTNDVSS